MKYRVPKEVYAKYSREIFGEPTMTPDEVVSRLRSEGCLDDDGRVMFYSDWLDGANKFTALASGRLYCIDYGAATYGHQSIFVA